MSETFKQYTERLFGYLGKQDAIKVQKATPGKIERLIKGVPRKKLTRPPAPGKWSVLEIICHLCDDEIVNGWRMRLMIARPGGPVTGFEQNDWARDFKYDKWKVDDVVTMFRHMRKNNLELLRLVSKYKFNQAYGIHEERGKETLPYFVKLTAGHDLNHLMQIRNILKRKP